MFVLELVSLRLSSLCLLISVCALLLRRHSRQAAGYHRETCYNMRPVLGQGTVMLNIDVLVVLNEEVKHRPPPLLLWSRISCGFSIGRGKTRRSCGDGHDVVSCTKDNYDGSHNRDFRWTICGHSDDDDRATQCDNGNFRGRFPVHVGDQLLLGRLLTGRCCDDNNEWKRFVASSHGSKRVVIRGGPLS